jgi:hypothetical protein
MLFASIGVRTPKLGRVIRNPEQLPFAARSLYPYGLVSVDHFDTSFSLVSAL